MAKEVKAWKAEDGTLHDNECAAACRDVELFVGKSPLAENQPFARKLVEWLTSEAPAIRKILEAHERACPRTVAEPCQPANDEITLDRRKSAAIGEMQSRGEPAKSWLTRNGFENLSDFIARAGSEDVDSWDRFRDEPEAFGNRSAANGS